MESNTAAAKSASYSKLNQSDFNNQNKPTPTLTATQSSLSRWKCVFVGLIIVACIVSIGLGIGFGLAKIHNKKPARLNGSHDFVGVYGRGAVSSQSPQCSVVGRDILVKGGSAVDAAIAALLCEGAYSPQSAGLGGGFFMTVFENATGKVRVVDAREVAPAKTTNETYAHRDSAATKYGGLAVAVPGELRGYQLAHAHYGLLNWSALFEPTIKICQEGVLISKYTAHVLESRAKERIFKEPSMRSVYVNHETGQLFGEGDVVYLPELAKTLDVIARKGADEFYEGELAKKLVDDLKAFDSLVELSDLKNYRAKLREPLRFQLDDGSTLYTVPPPGSGLILGLLMGILQKFDYGDQERTTTSRTENEILRYHRFVEACKYAYAKRGEIGDPDFQAMQHLTERLLSPELPIDIHRLIRDNVTFGPKHYDAVFDYANDHGTAHVSVLAPNGDAVSATSTLNTWFGAVLRSPSTGVILNNEMDDFSFPNVDNFYHLPPSPLNFVQPGKRPASSMAPSLVLNERGECVYSFGGSGGSKIISASAYVYMLHKYLNVSVEDSIASPRVHHQLNPNHVETEAAIAPEIKRGLMDKGHDVTGMDVTAAVHVIYRDADGTITAAADNRRNSVPAGL